jgi:RNA polymerase sigma-70 factor (ECF subfamily)
MAGEREETLEPRLRERWAGARFEEAARLLVEGYGPQILGYLVRTMRNEADACEVFGRLCEQLWRGLPRFEGRSSFKTWAYRLATHARTRFWEDPYRRRARPLESDLISKLEQQVRSRTLRHLRSEVKDRFARLRASLSPEEQSLLTLRIDKELAWTEIAEILAGPDESCSEGELKLRATALRQRFQRLKDKIRRLADEEGLLEAD